VLHRLDPLGGLAFDLLELRHAPGEGGVALGDRGAMLRNNLVAPGEGGG